MKKRQVQVMGRLLNGKSLEGLKETSPEEFLKIWTEINNEALQVIGYLGQQKKQPYV